MATVRVPIMNLFSGVARQPSSKRLTSELETVDNAILTLERSAEKRPPLEFIHGGQVGGFIGAVGTTVADPINDIAYFFFDKTETDRYIVIINRTATHPGNAASSGDSNNLIRIFKFREFTSDDSAEGYDFSQNLRVGDIVIEEALTGGASQTINYSAVQDMGSGYPNYTGTNLYKPDTSAPGGWGSTYVDDIWEYVKWNPEGRPARDTLKVTFFGNAMMILNDQVPASSWTQAVKTTDPNNIQDYPGAKKLTYRVSAVPDETGDYVLGGDWNSTTEQHEPVGAMTGTHPIQALLGADGGGSIALNDIHVQNLSSTTYGLGTIQINFGTSVTNINNLVTALNAATISIYVVALGTYANKTWTEVFGPLSPWGFCEPGVTCGSNLDPVGRGRLSFDTGGHSVVFYDGGSGTRAASSLGLTGQTFDTLTPFGQNLQPILALADDEDPSDTAPFNSMGGTAAGTIQIKDGSSTWNWGINESGTDTWGDARDHLESISSNALTLTLNADKTGSYIVKKATGTLPTSVADTTGNVAKRMGWEYNVGMHKPVRDDVQISSDLFERELGQNISSFNAIELPPEGNDQGGVNAEEDAIKWLYERGSGSGGNSEGFGKVWYTRAPFLTFPSGFYRCIDNTLIPHYQKVRSEDEDSVWYEPSMPFLLINTGSTSWKVEYPEWDPRETGNAANNPGPQALKKRRSPIKDIAFWRERLWFAIEDQVFSSRNNDWFNLWLGDPDNITSDDPIDIRASSGKYTRISSMIPFDDFMFINTGGETQYELQGSNNIISPTTAELAPTSFYSASSIIKPLVLGTQIYWFDSERLYLYNSSAGTSVNNASEVSIHAAGYLPKNFRCACVGPAQDSIFAVDEDNPDKLYIYTARWSGGDLVQHAFYRYVLPPSVAKRRIGSSGSDPWYNAPYYNMDDDNPVTTLPKPEIEYIWYSRNYLYMVVIRPQLDGTYSRFVERTSLQFLDINIPRMDRLTEVQNNLATGDDSSNDATWWVSGTNITHWKLPYWDPGLDEVILGPDWPTQAGQRLSLETGGITNTENGSVTEVSVNGNWNNISSTPYTSKIGSSYKMVLELSKIVYRDPSSGFPVEGTLALRMMNVKHFKSGVYDIEINRGNRNNIGSEDADDDGTKDKITRTTHVPLSINNSSDALGSLLIEGEGEFTSRVFGNADTTILSVTSDYPSPVSITSLEFIGKFKPYNSSIQS